MKAKPRLGLFDWAQIDRSVLIDPQRMLTVSEYRPPFVQRADMASKLYMMCQASGLDGVPMKAFLNHRVNRLIGRGKNRRPGRAPITGRALRQMYDALYNGQKSTLFIEIVSKWGWDLRVVAPPVRVFRAKKFKPTPPASQTQLSF